LLFFRGCLPTWQFFIENWLFFFKFIIWHLVIKPLASLFFMFFFLLSYHNLISWVIS
jgi:hypothetical protein